MPATKLALVLSAALLAPTTLSGQHLHDTAPGRSPSDPAGLALSASLSPFLSPPPALPSPETGWVAKHPKLVSLAATVIPTAVGVVMIASMDEPYTTTGRTVLNSAVLWSGPLLGPAVGYAAGDDAKRGLTGALVRTGIFAGTWLLAPSQDTNDGFLPNPEIDLGGGSSPDMGFWLLATGAILASAVVDIAVAR